MSSEISADWDAEAAGFLGEFASNAGARIERTQLTERLVAFVLHPEAEGAAQVSVIVSPYEVVVEAGRGTRFELDRLHASRAEVADVLDAIANGRLNERADWFGLRFTLDLRSGRTLSGRHFGRRVPRSTVQYQPW